MSDSEEPLPNTPLDEVPVSEIGEPLPAPLATVEQGEEMDTIWQMVNMVTPTKGTNSTQLKKYWSEFMARFRHYQHPLDESRTLLVVCHIAKNHLTRNHVPKDIFSLLTFTFLSFRMVLQVLQKVWTSTAQLILIAHRWSQQSFHLDCVPLLDQTLR
jgi:hypothetical protein